MVDFIRAADERFEIGQAESHSLCLGAMSVSAELLSHLLPDSRVVRDDDPTRRLVTKGRSRIVVLDPAPFLSHSFINRILPSTWDVTSDSIAAFVADVLEANELVLFKSCDLPPNTTRRQASEAGLADAYFPTAATHRSAIRWVNLRSDPVRERSL